MRHQWAWLFVFLFSLSFQRAFAQEGSDALTLSLRKDFGYSLGGRIQGKFTLSVEGPDNLVEVRFMVDDEVVSQAGAGPFRFSFRTSDFELGVHKISAVGTTQDGSTLQSETLRLEFISAEQGWESAVGVVVPLLILVVIIGVISSVAPTLLGRKTEFRIGEYGAAGGAVCGRCGFPFSRRVLSLNLLLGKLERCPHCGKWGLVRSASPAALTEAEGRYRDESRRGRLKPEDEQERRRRLVEESRFDD